MPKLRKKRKLPLKSQRQIAKAVKTAKSRSRQRKKGFNPTASFGSGGTAKRIKWPP